MLPTHRGEEVAREVTVGTLLEQSGDQEHRMLYKIE